MNGKQFAVFPEINLCQLSSHYYQRPENILGCTPTHPLDLSLRKCSAVLTITKVVLELKFLRCLDERIRDEHYLYVQLIRKNKLSEVAGGRTRKLPQYPANIGKYCNNYG